MAVISSVYFSHSINMPVCIKQFMKGNQNRQDLYQGFNCLSVCKIRAQPVLFFFFLKLATICFLLKPSGKKVRATEVPSPPPTQYIEKQTICYWETELFVWLTTHIPGVTEIQEICQIH